MKNADVMCRHCNYIFDSKIYEVEEEVGALDKAFEENETIKIMNCPRCGKPNKIYYFKDIVFLADKIKEKNEKDKS